MDVLKAMAACPSFEPLHEAIKNLEADQQKATVVAFITMERAPSTPPRPTRRAS